jgi:prepilin-type N-terminal cleavage/methylation domain
MTPAPRHAKAARAFTLIELLTVIAIIGILAAIIIPTVGKVRETARKSQSVSNVRQLSMAMITFANDNKGGRLPSAANTTASISVPTTWDVALLPYMGADPSQLTYSVTRGLTGGLASLIAVFHCPLDSRPFEPNADGAYPRSYSISPVVINLGGSYAAGVSRPAGTGVPLSSIRTPSKMVVINRTPVGWESATNVVGRQDQHSHAGPNPDTPGNADFWGRFNGRALLGFADGHAALLTPEEVKPFNQRDSSYVIP